MGTQTGEISMDTLISNPCCYLIFALFQMFCKVSTMSRGGENLRRQILKQGSLVGVPVTEVNMIRVSKIHLDHTKRETMYIG